MAVTDLWYRKGGKEPTKRHGRGMRYRVTVPGHPSKSFRLKKPADAYEAKLLASGEVSQVVPVLVGDLLDLYWQSKSGLSLGGRSAVASGVAHARSRWADVLAADVERHEVEAWIGNLTWSRMVRTETGRELRTFPASRTLREKALQALAGALAIAQRRGQVPRNEAAGISLAKVERRDPRFFTVAEVERIAVEVGEWWAPMVWFLATTGVRIGEACSRDTTDVRQVKPGKWRVRVTKTKGRRARDVPVPASVVAMLDLDRLGPLFRYPTTGERVKPGPFRNRVVQPAAVRAGLGKIHVHDLRHTAASWMIAAGADVKKVQEALGHKSAAMTLDLYGHLWDHGIDDVASRMDSMLHG